MSSNVGLTTPRGSGTSGYVQRNMSYLRPRDQPRDAPEPKSYHQRAPDRSILEHDRKREVEVRCLELQDKLEDEGVDEDEITEQVEALRRKLTAELEAGKDVGGRGQNARGLKSHQVHELAAAKMGKPPRISPGRFSGWILTGSSGDGASTQRPRHFKGLPRREPLAPARGGAREADAAGSRERHATSSRSSRWRKEAFPFCVPCIDYCYISASPAFVFFIDYRRFCNEI